MIVTNRDELDFVFPPDSMVDSSESPEHRSKKLSIGLQYFLNGYDVDVEVYCHGYFIDVVAVNDSETVAVEIGQTTKDKVKLLTEEFDTFIHKSFTRNGEVIKSVRTRDGSTTIRVDEDTRDKLNELVEYYNEHERGSFSQKTVINMLIDEKHSNVFVQNTD